MIVEFLPIRKSEDSPHSSGDDGIQMLGVRRDSLVAGAGTDGDYEALPIANILSTIGVPVHVVGAISVPIISDVAAGAALGTNSSIPIGGPDMLTGNKGNAETAVAAVTTTTARGMIIRHVGFPASGTLGDSMSNPTTVNLGALNAVWNASTWERLAAARNALNSTGIGIANAAQVAQFDNTSPTAITENQFGHLRMSALRALFTAQLPSSDSVLAPSNAKNTASVTAVVKASAGNVLSLYAINKNAAVRYLQLHNKATGVSAGETAQRYWAIPAGTAAVPGVLRLDQTYFASAANFATGINYAFSTTAATYTAATAADHDIDINYV